ncbi:hypothetical protein JXA88_15065 [Candidatus Fermentibacteria bacterium]|nr:hypothetical protein [Candidatus Fermentibacteria bacterium]
MTRSQPSVIIAGLAGLLLTCRGPHAAVSRGVLVVDPSRAVAVQAAWVTSEAADPAPGEDTFLSQLIAPIDIAVGPGDSIYVADRGACRIVVYSPNGTPVRGIGRIGEGPGEFRHLRRLAVEDGGSLWALEDQKLQFLDPSGVPRAAYNGMNTMGTMCDIGVWHAGGVWVGTELEGYSPRIYRAEQQGGAWGIRSEGAALRVHTRGLVPSPIIQDLEFSMVRSRHGGFFILLPCLSKRKPWAALQEYDANGALVADYDLQLAGQDVGKMLAPWNDMTFLRTFGPLAADQGSGCGLLCGDVFVQFDSRSRSLSQPVFLELEESDNHEFVRVKDVRDAEFDSAGRLNLLLYRDDGQPLLAQVREPLMERR